MSDVQLGQIKDTIIIGAAEKFQWGVAQSIEGCKNTGRGNWIRA